MNDHYLKPVEDLNPGDKIDQGIYAGLSPRRDTQGPNTLNVRLANGYHYTESTGAQVRVWARTCLHCDASLESEQIRNSDRGTVTTDVIWVDALSGDEGGTYDYCTVNPTNLHVPAAL